MFLARYTMSKMLNDKEVFVFSCITRPLVYTESLDLALLFCIFLYNSTQCFHWRDPMSHRSPGKKAYSLLGINRSHGLMDKSAKLICTTD